MLIIYLMLSRENTYTPITTAIHSESGYLISIHDVKSGLECDCICAGCGGKLVAKKGDILDHHFAHYVESDCNNGQESAIHKLSKNIINSVGSIYVPNLEFNLMGLSKKIRIFNGGSFKYSNVILEKKYGEVIPDIVLSCGDKKIFVEIAVTHFIDNEKREKLRNIGIPTMEIDLAYEARVLDPMRVDADMDVLVRRILHAVDNKKWAFNAWPKKTKYLISQEFSEYRKFVDEFENKNIEKFIF